MRLQIHMGTEEEYHAAIPCCPEGDDLRAYYEGKLEAASDRGSDSIDFKAISAGEKTSDTFRDMGIIEDAVMTFLREHDKPETVRIICTDEEIARLYKVVYNFRFADTKADRMEDSNWD